MSQEWFMVEKSVFVYLFVFFLKKKIWWKLYEIPISVSINKVVLGHSHDHSFMYFPRMLS